MSDAWAEKGTQKIGGPASGCSHLLLKLHLATLGISCSTGFSLEL